ncbi:MAG: D-tyrosyl-tRNA(Tyr) deacylase [Candidatus Cloacimonetes bacterium]|nr:D-tyrosyl-tRNA(Tyr) deacylase [Candidatus Cloacimonadota bacterium]
MRLVLQRVQSAQVEVSGEVIGRIGRGLLVLVGIGKADDSSAINWLANKTVELRIFEDENQKMNLGLRDIKGEILLVSQFTLYADCHKGRRPGFDQAADPEIAERQFEEFVKAIDSLGFKAQTGKFGADMKVSLINDGPVTIILEK